MRHLEPRVILETIAASAVVCGSLAEGCAPAPAGEAAAVTALGARHRRSSCLVCHPSLRTDKPFGECLSCHPTGAKE